MSAMAPIIRDVRASLPLWLGLVIVFFAAFHLWQLTLLVLSFGELPNYVTIHDWPVNIGRIARMTPSVADMIPIMLDEWLIEIGSMNYAYGHGIADWSFVIMPAKAVIVLLMSLLLATTVIMLRVARATCPPSSWIAPSIGAAGGAFSAGLATMTITWVAHCGLPTWIVGLSIMGVDAVTAFAIEPFGRWLAVFGILTLSLNVIGLGALAAESAASADTPTRLRPARATS